MELERQTLIQRRGMEVGERSCGMPVPKDAGAFPWLRGMMDIHPKNIHVPRDLCFSGKQVLFRGKVGVRSQGISHSRIPSILFSREARGVSQRLFQRLTFHRELQVEELGMLTGMDQVLLSHRGAGG